MGAIEIRVGGGGGAAGVVSLGENRHSSVIKRVVALQGFQRGALKEAESARCSMHLLFKKQPGGDSAVGPSQHFSYRKKQEGGVILPLVDLFLEFIDGGGGGGSCEGCVSVRTRATIKEPRTFFCAAFLIFSGEE